MDIDAVRQIKARHEAEIMAKKNVVGLGIGFRERDGAATDELSLVVFVSKKLPIHALSAQDHIPPYIEGVPTDVKEVGTVKAK